MRVPRIAFDIMLLAFYLVTANPATTGMPLHEYLGVGVFVLMAVSVGVPAWPALSNTSIHKAV